MTILLFDPRVSALPVHDTGEPLCPLPFAPTVLVRAGLAARLTEARAALLDGLDLRVVEGHRTPAAQQAIIDRYTTEPRLAHPGHDEAELNRGSCYFDAEVDPLARENRTLLAAALDGAGLVNYPTKWWHWSFGDRYWALVTGAEHALYGPVDAAKVAA